MVSTLYRRLFVPVVVVATLALVGAGVLLVVRPPGHGALAATICGASLLLTGALLPQHRRPEALATLVTAIAALMVTAALWGAVRSTILGAVVGIPVVALLALAVTATLLRADPAPPVEDEA